MMVASLAIAHVLSSFGMGGQERVALDLAAAQRRAGCRAIAISLAAATARAPIAQELERRGIAARTVAKRDGFDLSLVPRLACALARARVDVVHTHNPQALIYGAPAARLVGATVVHTKHGANPLPSRTLALLRWSARLAHAYVAVSSATAEVARARHEAAPARLRAIPNGVDLARFHPDDAARAALRAELAIPDDAWVVGSVGRLAPEKDQASLVRALAPSLGPRVRLLLVGDGPGRAALAALAASLGVGAWVTLAGVRPDVERVYAALDVFALPSLSEGMPLVIAEAMAAALPVVATAVGGVPEMVTPDETGALLQPGDAAALARRLDDLARDRERARRLGAAARARAIACFSSERMARDYLALYTELRA